MVTKENNEIGEVEELLEMIEDERKRSRKKTTIFSLVLVAIVLIYGYVILQKVKSNFAGPVVSESISKKMSELSPFFHIYLEQAMQGVPETYQQAFITEMKKKMPGLQANVMKEFDKTRDHMLTQFKKSLDKKLDGQFMKTQEDRLLNVVAKGNDPQKVAADKAYFERQLNRLATDISNRLIGKFQTDLDSLAGVLKTFPRDSESALDQKQAQKMFVHFWLQLVDKELMSQKGGLL